ncbi:8-amino-7-oxononanoate synthase [Rheinheimera sp. MMS21-TC3]|uniref:aminotransferase class I/II-fold pyridoxal phosphate-dependent enzyme n=1 Tax=Rheinheimera sp. MMS21-TC3 TaxID=3072790 RepID=UPI0028C450E7|nr:8-amino-7-oxononanoate synthase [Rheinheimera sp. MMS21-TC3]WNO61135.1 8-amino-7-oxononanoate synthase [Rheinheimera sp. MMS21-TC3]
MKIKLEQLQQALLQREALQLKRTPVTLARYQGRMLTVASKDYLNFSGNDYLGLANDPKVLQAYAEGALQYGAGSTGSPLITGQHSIHQQLNDSLCDWLGFERTLLFSSGFAANQAMLMTLTDKDDLLLLDRLSHASLIDGAIHSKASFKRFGHNDLAALTKLLQRYNSEQQNTMVVTEGVFSMDGDTPNLAAMVQLCQDYNAGLLLDDAHGLGVLGDQGRGSAAEQGVAPSALFCTMANFGKAIGVGGAFIGASKTVIDYLEQFARHYVYSTALSPALCAAVLASVNLCRTEQWRRDKLQQNIQLFRQLALAADLPILASNTPIQAVVVGCAEKALQLSLALKQQQIWLTAIRPPTVATGSSRLRVTLNCMHQADDIKQLVNNLRKHYDCIT